MNHEQILNSMLASNCQTRTAVEWGISLQVFDLHCNSLWMIVKMVPNEDEEYTYKILAKKFQNNVDDSVMNIWVSEQASQLGIVWRT